MINHNIIRKDGKTEAFFGQIVQCIFDRYSVEECTTVTKIKHAHLQSLEDVVDGSNARNDSSPRVAKTNTKQTSTQPGKPNRLFLVLLVRLSIESIRSTHMTGRPYPLNDMIDATQHMTDLKFLNWFRVTRADLTKMVVAIG